MIKLIDYKFEYEYVNYVFECSEDVRDAYGYGLLYYDKINKQIVTYEQAVIQTLNTYHSHEQDNLNYHEIVESNEHLLLNEIVNNIVDAKSLKLDSNRYIELIKGNYNTLDIIYIHTSFTFNTEINDTIYYLTISTINTNQMFDKYIEELNEGE